VFGMPYLAALVAALINSAIPGSGQPLLMLAVFGFGFVWLPLHANGVYYHWVRAEIERARIEFPGQVEAQMRYLEARGGVNAQLPYLVLIGFMVMSMMLAGSVSQIGQ